MNNNEPPRKLTFEEIKSSRPDVGDIAGRTRFPISVIAENIRSLYNVGSIFRTSDGACIEKLYLAGDTGFPPRMLLTSCGGSRPTAI